MISFRSRFGRGTGHVPAQVTVRRASKPDLGFMQDFLDREGAGIPYFPCYDLSKLGEPWFSGLTAADYFLAFDGERLVGICGIWRQTHLKQTRIAGYAPLYRVARPFYNTWARIWGSPRLPRKNHTLDYLCLHTILIRGRDAGIFRALLSYIMTTLRESGVDCLLCGLDTRDPLQRVFETVSGKKQLYGNYYLVNDGREIPPELSKTWFYLETARI